MGEIAGADYRVKLEVFEGPLDLLLYLIRKNDIDIRDIPIAMILNQYLETLKLMKELNMDIAGEFILTASELAYIKSRMLLPIREPGEGEEEVDPRAELVERLLEYQRYKIASQDLGGRPLLGKEVFLHPRELLPDDPEEPLLDVDTWRLFEAFRIAMAKLPPEEGREIERDGLSVRERMIELVTHFQKVRTTLLSKLLETAPSRDMLVLTFLALLEMTRLKMIRIFQQDLGEDIHIESLVGEVFVTHSKEEDRGGIET